MPNKQFWLHFAQLANLVGAFTTALVAIYPLLSGKPDWTQIILAFVFTAVFTIASSLAAHINNGDLRSAVVADLTVLWQQATSRWSATRAGLQQQQPIQIPPDKPSGNV